MNGIHIVNMVHGMNIEMTRRERNRAARLAEILACGMAIVEKDGLDALTIQRLAREMDWAVGAVYRYFPSKNALVEALETQAVNGIREALEDERNLARAAGATADQTLRRLARRYYDVSLVRPEAFRLVSLMLGDPKPLLPDEEAVTVMEAVMPLLREVAALVQQAQSDGDLTPGDPMERTVLFWLGVHGAVQTAKLYPVPRDHKVSPSQDVLLHRKQKKKSFQ